MTEGKSSSEPPGPTLDPAEQDSERKRLFNLSAVTVILGVLAIIGTALGLSKLRLIEYAVTVLALAPVIIRCSIPRVRDSRFWEPVLYTTIACVVVGGAVLLLNRGTQTNVNASGPRQITPKASPVIHHSPSTPNASPSSAAPTASFKLPANHSGVNFCYTASGTSANIPAGKVLWLVVLAPTKADTKPTAGNSDGGQPYVVEAIHPSKSGTWRSRRYQLGDPGDVRPYWFELYLADPAIAIPGPDVGAQFSLLQEARFLSVISIHRLPAPPGTSDGSC